MVQGVTISVKMLAMQGVLAYIWGACSTVPLVRRRVGAACVFLHWLPHGAIGVKERQMGQDSTKILLHFSAVSAIIQKQWRVLVAGCSASRATG